MVTELTIEEEVHYSNYGSIELCDYCSDYHALYKFDYGADCDRTNYIIYDGNFHCLKCRREYDK